MSETQHGTGTAVLAPHGPHTGAQRPNPAPPGPEAVPRPAGPAQGPPAAPPQQSPAWQPVPADCAPLIDEMYSERACLVARLAYHHLYDAFITEDPGAGEPGWHLVCLRADGTLMAWPVHPGDVEKFNHVTRTTPDDHRLQPDAYTPLVRYQDVRRPADVSPGAGALR